MRSLVEKFESLAERYATNAYHAHQRGDMLLSARWDAKADALWFAASEVRKETQQ